MKTALVYTLYESGLFSLYHRVRHSQTLTTVMLHRVLPLNLQEDYGSNPEWTLTDTIFSEFLQFIKRHYNVVSLETVEQSNCGNIDLPKRSLLLTFDDGWLDNFRFAYPALLENTFPAAIFVATDHIASIGGLWQEKLYSAVQRNPKSLDAMRLLAPDPDNVFNVNSLVSQLQQLEPVERSCSRIMKIADAEQSADRKMLNADEIKEMSKSGVSFGVHGASHRPLAGLSNAELHDEIQRSVKTIRDITGTTPRSISFPHGNYSPEVLACCNENGLTSHFTSTRAVQAQHLRKHLNITKLDPYPRSHIAERTITHQLRFSPAKAANNLFRLPMT